MAGRAGLRAGDPAALGDLGVLLEPTSVLAKAWDQVDRISQRAFFLRGRALVTGAGPIGLLACLLGVQRGYEVHVVDLATEGPKRDLVEALGAHYHAGEAADVDADVEVVIECTGLGAVGRSAAQRVVSGGIMCLTGIMNVEPQFDVDATTMNRNDGAAQPGAIRDRERRAAPLGAGGRRARDCRPGMVAGNDHPARAAHSLDRGAGAPARGHQSRRRSHGMTASSAVPWSGTPGLLSEGPRWHEERQELLWVDILGGHIHRGTLAADGSLDEVTTISLDRHVGAVAPALEGGYVVAAGPGFLFVDEDGTVRELAQPEAGRTDVRMNDGACDAQGRFWAGTMAYDESPGAGALYRLELDGSCTTVLTGLTIANGIGWSPDGTAMYLNDSGTGCVETFRFDGATGAITKRRTLVRSTEPGVVPDGLTVDAEGGIWVAWWAGARSTATPRTGR